MAQPMLKYNRALDCLALAAQAMHRDGDEVLAARLFAKAMKQPDIQAAINTIEATNRVAFAQLEASNKATKEATPATKPVTTTAAAKPAAAPTKNAPAKPVSAAKRVQAAEEMVEEAPVVEEEMPVEEEPVIEADAFDGDPLDDVVEDEEVDEAPVEPVVAGRRMAEVLSSMKRTRDGK